MKNKNFNFNFFFYYKEETDELNILPKLSIFNYYLFDNLIFNLIKKKRLNSDKFNASKDVFLEKEKILYYKAISPLKQFSFINEENYLLNYNLYLDKFIYLKNPSFISFFLNNFIDVPICFKKSKSLKLKNFELPLLKFINFLMKEGKKEKMNKIFFKSIRFPEFSGLNGLEDEFEDWKEKPFLDLINDKKEDKENKFKLFIEQNDWIFVYFFYNKLLLYNHNIYGILFEFEFYDYYKNMIIFNKKIFNFSSFFKNSIFNLLNKIIPIFSYFIYNVDKNIRKFSRGKSGKYIFIWKYIAQYKRIFIGMKWIIKEIKFNYDSKINKRIKKTFFKLFTDLESTFAWKSKIFSHNYVFKNFKKTLMNNLQTITK